MTRCPTVVSWRCRIASNNKQFTYVYIYIYMCICICICICIYIYIYVYVCMYIYIYICICMRVLHCYTRQCTYPFRVVVPPVCVCKTSCAQVMAAATKLHLFSYTLRLTHVSSSSYPFPTASLTNSICHTWVIASVRSNIHAC